MSGNSILLNMLSARTGGGLTYAQAILPRIRKYLPDCYVLAGPSLEGYLGDDKRMLRIQRNWLAGYGRLIWESANLKGLLNTYGITTLYTPYQVAVQPKTVRAVCALRNMEPFFAGRYQYASNLRLRNELLRHLTKHHLHRADLVIAVSNFARDFAVESLGLSDAKCVTIYHGRDEGLAVEDTELDATVRSRLGITGKYVFTAGSLLPYRRLEDIISAFERAITPLDRHALLAIAGSGSDPAYQRQLQEHIAASRHAESIRFLGYLGRQEMKALYKGCEVFVSASEIEACPNIGIEAMTAGCAVIAANAGPAHEIYGDGAVLYSPRSVDELSEWIRLLWVETGTNGQLRLRAQARSSSFSWEECAKRTSEVLYAIA